MKFGAYCKGINMGKTIYGFYEPYNKYFGYIISTNGHYLVRMETIIEIGGKECPYIKRNGDLIRK